MRETQGECRCADAGHQYPEIHAGFHGALEKLEEAKKAHASLPARVRLGDAAPRQEVLDTEMKMFTHVVRLAAYNTGLSRGDWEAHATVRKVLAPGR